MSTATKERFPTLWCQLYACHKPAFPRFLYCLSSRVIIVQLNPVSRGYFKVAYPFQSLSNHKRWLFIVYLISSRWILRRNALCSNGVSHLKHRINSILFAQYIYFFSEKRELSIHSIVLSLIPYSIRSFFTGFWICH